MGGGDKDSWDGIKIAGMGGGGDKDSWDGGGGIKIAGMGGGDKDSWDVITLRLQAIADIYRNIERGLQNMRLCRVTARSTSKF